MPSSDSVEPSPNATTEKGDDLVEETDVERGHAEGDDKDDGDGGAGDEENDGENTMHVNNLIPLDFVHVKVQLDGETDVETSEHLGTVITYTNLHLSRS